MNTYEIGKALHAASAVELAEIFAWYNKMRGKTIPEEKLTRDDMGFNPYELVNMLGEVLHEILNSEEKYAEAWWKDDIYFGRDTPRRRFEAQSEELKQRTLMETAMRAQELFVELEKDGKIDPDSYSDNSFDIWNKLKDLSYEFEYTHYESADFFGETEDFFTEKLMAEYPVKAKMECLSVYKDDVIKGWEGDDNLLDLEVERPVLFAWFKEERLESFKGDDKTVSDEGLFEEWLAECTADHTEGLYDWIVNRGFTCKIHD